MSARASRAKAKAEPAAAAAAAPAAAPAKARATRRKRGEEDDAAPAAASSADAAPAPSEPKRARRGRGADSAEPVARSPSPALSTGADEAEGSAMADAPRASPLDSLRVGAVGHMFCAADSASGRPPLPLILAQLTLDFLSATDIVNGAAHTSRGGYATAVEYAKLVAHNALRGEVGASTAESSSSSSSSSAAAAAAAAASFPAAAAMIGVRSEVTRFTSIRAITDLLCSRLRSLVSGVQTQSVGTIAGLFPLDAKLVDRLSSALPSLRSLACQLSSGSPHTEFAFPPALRSLRVLFCFRVAPHLSKKEREARSSKPAPSWDTAKCDEFVVNCTTRIAQLPQLHTLHIGTLGNLGNDVAKASWIAPLVGLRSLRCFGAEFPSYHRSLEACAPLLRQMTQLEALHGWGSELRDMLPVLLAPGHSLRLQHLDLNGLALTADMLNCLLSLSDTLTDLNPHVWVPVDLSATLPRFSQLRRLAFFEDKRSPGPSAEHIVQLLESLPEQRRQRVEDLLLWYDALTDAQFRRVLQALPRLVKLELHSTRVSTLAPFAAAASLASTLKTLRIRVPAVPRDDVAHLLNLLSLESLNFAGSFAEPLSARQLFPFQPPYPKEPLRALRTFYPRSSNDPTPTPPVDLVARAAAYADFDARVRAGEVKAAELLNSAQLSGAFQFLSVADFSHAGRACRAWRAAASLPSAWGIASSTSGATSEDKTAASVDPPLGSGLWSSDTHHFLLLQSLGGGHFPGSGRILKLSDRQPQCDPSILPQLPLWRHVRKIALAVTESGRFWSPIHRNRDHALTLALTALSQLPRLQSLYANLFDFRDQAAILQLMGSLPHLRQLQMVGIPNSAYKLLGALEELDVGWPEAADYSHNGCPGAEIAALHCLRRLSMAGNLYSNDLGPALRKLSADHSLRELSLQCRSGYQFQAVPTEEPNRAFKALLHALAGEGGAAAATAPAAPTLDAVHGLDSNEPAPASSPSAPALLEVLRVVWDRTGAGEFPLQSVLRLPRLRHLHFQTVSSISLDLGAIEAHVSGGGTLPPLEVLFLSRARLDQAALQQGIGFLTQLRELRLGEPLGNNYAAFAPAQPTSRWGQKLPSLPQLEVLALSGVQIDPQDVAVLDQLPKLRALSLIRQKALQVSDLSVLPRLSRLIELHLEANPLLLLQRRDWMKDMGRPDVDHAATTEDDDRHMRDAPAAAAASSSSAAAAAAAAASIPSAPSDQTEGVLPLLRQCASLRLLRWITPYPVLEANESYTARRTYVKVRGRVSADLQHARLSNESARERQALRSLLLRGDSSPCDLRIESKPTFKYEAQCEWFTLRASPAAGSAAEAQIQSEPPPLPKDSARSAFIFQTRQAIKDRQAMEAEREQESEWKAEAEKQAAKKNKGKKK